MSSVASPPAPEPQRMQCMEVWGGNRNVNRAFQMPGLDVWVYSQAFEQAKEGGDVYYLSSCASGRITRALLADVSGHGAVAANVALHLRDLMRANVNVINQRDFVTGMNRAFVASSRDGGFATALVCTYFAPRRTLQLCNAGHPPPFLYQSARKQWSILRWDDADAKDAGDSGISNIPFGIMAETQYPFVQMRLRSGDVVVMYSDAWVEAERRDGGLLGVDGFFDVVQQTAGEDAARIIPRTLELMRDRTKGLEHDDATLVVMRASPTRVRFKDNLLALWRLLSGVRLNTEFRKSAN